MLRRTLRHNIYGALKALPCVLFKFDFLFLRHAMETSADQRAVDLYATLMDEAKIRALSINTIGHAAILPYPLVREYAYLQLRMLCELIALGCLVAHGDITQTKYFQRDAYKADEILKRLEELNENFYPIPVRPIPRKDGRIEMHPHPPDFDFLTKDDLISLYAKCGDILHKGRLPRVILPPAQIDNSKEIERWGQKTLNLLSCHRITRLNRQVHMLTVLASVNDGGNVRVLIGRDETPPRS
jgi:hypothetical protein